jgi:hypothetical protein
MALALTMLKSEVASWPGISVRLHQFVAQEFRYRQAEVGHIHLWGDADIPFTRAVRDLLLEEHLAMRHRWIPDSGWVTFHVGNQTDAEHAIWLMRLSYLRYALKADPDPVGLLEREAKRLRLAPRLVSLLAAFMPGSAGGSEGKGAEKVPSAFVRAR